jgi:hypothetical protein
MDLTPTMIVVLMLVFIVAWAVLKLTFMVVCKLKPFREMTARKPRLALLPKYKTEVALDDGLVDPITLEKKLASFGFQKSSEKDGKIYFVRGSILGGFSFSIKHIKIKLSFKSLQNRKSEITLEGSKPIAFDTGDCWSFLTELSEKLEKNIQ